MKVYKRKKARKFLVSKKNNIFLKDVGKIHLQEDENLTITCKEKKDFEICRKSWGYYATPSLNFRLKRKGLKAVLVKQNLKYFILLVDMKKKEKFKNYIKIENYKIIRWF
tara:strand:+ start:163 stop:492 length:330 start_codon:yes stop_codon:yes gene_type:complete